jgi:hypothetical protein
MFCNDVVCVCLFTQGGVALVLGTCSQLLCVCLLKQDFVLVFFILLNVVVIVCVRSISCYL